MSLRLPRGKHLAVAITPDFDAHANWMGAGLTGPSYVARGEFGAEVGLSRVLAALRIHDIRATFFSPGQILETYPDKIREILDEGHEIAAHGCYHENLTTLGPGRERQLLERQLEQHQRITKRRPRGYRAPGWDFSEATVGLLEEYGFEWDSSLMGRDFEPYHPRTFTLSLESASIPSTPSRLLEFPVSWYLDDFQFFEFAPAVGVLGGVAPDTVYQIWATNFDYALEHVVGGVFTLTVHPQTIGRAHNLVMFERFLRHVAEHEGVWFTSLSDIFDAWVDGP